MDRMIPEIEKAYRHWRRTELAKPDTALGKIAAGLNRGALEIARRKAKPYRVTNWRPLGALNPATRRKRRSPEVREKMRQAALKVWAKRKRTG